jgi:hypothetical protein
MERRLPSHTAQPGGAKLKPTQMSYPIKGSIAVDEFEFEFGVTDNERQKAKPSSAQGIPVYREDSQPYRWMRPWKAIFFPKCDKQFG